MILISVAFTCLTACGGGTGNNTKTPATPVPSSISASGGATQSTAVGNAFAALNVTVLDQNSKPVSGVTVSFTAPIGSANCKAVTKKAGAVANTPCAPPIPTCTFASGATTTATTNSSGIANSGVCTANGTPGSYTATGTVSGITTPASFSLTNTTGAAATINTAGGSGQTAAVSTAFAAPLVATVVDSHFNPISGVTVAFAAPSSGASCSFANGTTTAVTNSLGTATSAVCTANATPGTFNVAASTNGVSGSASFSLTNSIGAPSTITASSGSAQTAAVSTAFELPLVATVVDGHSNPVSGATVTFTAPSSGASCAFANGVTTATTNSLGVATSAVCTANTTVGSYAVTASANGVSAPASFTLSNSSGAAATITATGGSGQSANTRTAFEIPLTALVVDGHSNPISGVSVTFTAPGSGASGIFQSSNSTTETDVTNANGIAVSSTFSANSYSSAYSVTATTGNLSASFNLTNNAVVLTGSNYVFYLRGIGFSSIGQSEVFYSLAGSVNIDSGGNVQGGEQDYNDAEAITSPPIGDSIYPLESALVVDPVSGMGTLTLNTSNAAIGVAGTEILAVQFVNPNHAMILQFDGSGTSTGTLDLQSATTPANQGYAFIMSGVDQTYYPFAFGGVFSLSGNDITNGIVDANVSNNSLVGGPFAATLSGTDSFGRGLLSFDQSDPTYSYYVVGPQVMRWMEIDPTSSTVGSVFGQGTTTTFDNASLGNTVFGVEGNSYGFPYAAAGMFTVPSSGTLLGVGDVDEVGMVASAAPITGSYSISNSIDSVVYNGYGTLTLDSGTLRDVSALRIYMTDPTLNLNDPNNPIGGGGALVLDMDPMLAGGIGFLLPQTDTTAADFTGTFAFQAQDYNPNREFDYAGSTYVSGMFFNGAAQLNDLFGYFGGVPTDYNGAGFTGPIQPDSNNAGRYTISGLSVGAGANSPAFDMAIYQVSSSQLVWMDEDGFSLSLGLLQQTGQPTLIPGVKQHTKKTATKIKR